jgi:quercetin 2,3-dioxygenase
VTGRIEVRRAAERFRTTEPGVDMWHCLSYGRHYDPGNIRFGALLACNDIRLDPGHGFPEHPHAGVDIVSWVVEGRLRHEHAPGGQTVLEPGMAQLLSTGRGARHAEANSGDQPLRFLQMWVLPADPDRPVSYDLADLAPALGSGRLARVAGGDGAALRLGRQTATLHTGRLTGPAELPLAPYVQVYVARGSVHLIGTDRLGEGDEARLTGVAGARIEPLSLPAEVLVWEMHEQV